MHEPGHRIRRCAAPDAYPRPGEPLAPLDKDRISANNSKLNYRDNMGNVSNIRKVSTPAAVQEPAVPGDPGAAPRAAAAARTPSPAGGALYEMVAERLRGLILSHTLSPGAWIDEQRLCADFGISRTPLREALKVLAAEGLITMKLRRGAYVTEMSERDVTEVYHLLALLESDAAAEVARRATDAELDELGRLHDALEASAGDRERFFALNERFHLRLLEMAGNRWRMQIVADLRKVMKLNRHHSLFREGRVEESLAEHRALMAALRARDSARAEALTREHFRNGLAAATMEPASSLRSLPPERPSPHIKGPGGL